MGEEEIKGRGRRGEAKPNNGCQFIHNVKMTSPFL
jgi:hypothetical protein